MPTESEGSLQRGAQARVGAVIVGGGRGSRFGADVPKQFQPLGGRPLIAWALEFFLGLPTVEVVVPVLPPEGEERLGAWRAGLSAGARAKLLAPAAGGTRRQDSVLAGLRALPGEVEIAAVHDGARPFPPRAAVEEAIARLAADAARRTGAILAVRATDTLKLAAVDGTIARSLDRTQVWAAQTPQVFRRAELIEALEALGAAADVTDEAQAMERRGGRVWLVEGDAENFKVTTPADLARAEALLARRRSSQP